VKSTCPTCRGAAVRAGNKVFPFCSDRCQLIDLGRWLSEDYRIPAEPADPLVDGAGEDGGEQRS
jgi:endogenous inhibitor of DNA gyrase (YacG/DUF329 family)